MEAVSVFRRAGRIKVLRAEASCAAACWNLAPIILYSIVPSRAYANAFQPNLRSYSRVSDSWALHVSYTSLSIGDIAAESSSQAPVIPFADTLQPASDCIHTISAHRTGTTRRVRVASLFAPPFMVLRSGDGTMASNCQHHNSRSHYDSPILYCFGP